MSFNSKEHRHFSAILWRYPDVSVKEDDGSSGIQQHQTRCTFIPNSHLANVSVAWEKLMLTMQDGHTEFGGGYHGAISPENGKVDWTLETKNNRGGTIEELV
jgi:hypothetical protein